MNIINQKEIPKHKWESFFISKSMVELFHNKNESILLIMGKDFKLWLNVKYVETNPYTNDIKISIADNKKYTLLGKDKNIECTGKDLFKLFKGK